MQTMFRSLATAALILLLAAGLALLGRYGLDRPADSVRLTNGAHLQWVDCWLDEPVLRDIDCAWLYPSDGDALQTGESLRLPVMVIRRRPWELASGPLLYLNGGPGVASLPAEDAAMASWLEWYRSLGWAQDLVVFDQRGTGMSLPQPHCSGMIEEVRKTYARALSLDQEMADWDRALRRCLSQVKTEGYRLEALNSPRSAQDALELMALIDPDAHWNVYGVSYGTRVALEMMRREPDRLRALVLDSAYPPERDGLLEAPAALFGALSKLQDLCIESTGCGGEGIDPLSDLARAMTRMDEHPVSLVLRDPGGGEDFSLVVNGHRLADLVVNSLYFWDLIESLPRLLHQLGQHGQSPLLRAHAAAFLAMQVDPSFNDAGFHSVECFDRRFRGDLGTFMAQVPDYPPLRSLFEDWWRYDSCRFWDSGQARAGLHQPARSRLPVLFLNGELDPVTPAAWAETAAQGLPNSQRLVLQGIGHAVVDSDKCGAGLVVGFLAHPDRKVDRDCLRRHGPVRFSSGDQGDQ